MREDRGFHITVPGKPVAGTGLEFTKGGRAYTVKSVSDWKAVVRLFAVQECPSPLLGPLQVVITVSSRKSGSWPKNPTAKCPWPWAPYRRPDLDNINKPVFDALNGVGWNDDAQVVQLVVNKLFAEEPQVDIWVRPANESYMTWVFALVRKLFTFRNPRSRVSAEEL